VRKRITVIAVTVAVAVIIIILGIYIAMLISTNSVMREVRSAFLLELDPAVTEGRAIGAYNYDWLNRREGREVDEIYLRLRRQLTFHNFQEGYIWVSYIYRVHDTAGRLMTSSRAGARWRIERIDGEWEIVQIYEAP